MKKRFFYELDIYLCLVSRRTICKMFMGRMWIVCNRVISINLQRSNIDEVIIRNLSAWRLWMSSKKRFGEWG